MSAFTLRALRRTLLGALIMGVFVVVSLSAPSAQAAPGINQQLNFQGRLLTSSGATVADGYYNIQFKIYQDGTGTAAGNPTGTLKWTESWLNSGGNGVQVKNGYLSLQLGSITSLSSVDWNQDTLWLSINVGNTNVSCTPFTSCAGDGEMLPMKRLGSTPYAFNAGQLGGLTSAQFLQLAQGVQTEAGTNTSSIAINKIGSGGNFLNLQASGVDVFKITNAGDITFGSNIDHAISVASAPAATAGKSLTISAGTAGTGGSALTGGTLVLQGGNGGGTAGNGGNVTLDAGAAAVGGTGGTITIGGTNASAITLGQNTTLSAGKSLTLTGSSTRPASPTEGMVYYDTTTKQLLVYANGKWQSDRSVSTKIVAASNASQALKDSADYVATGTSDQTEINAALTAASGGKVYLTEGTYTINASISIPNNTALNGAGAGTIITIPNAFNADINAVTNTTTSGNGTGIIIQDLKLEGNSANQTSGIMRGAFFNGVGSGSGSSAVQGGKIAHVWANNWRNNGIDITSGANNTLVGNTTQGNAYGINLTQSNNNSITANVTQGNGSAGMYIVTSSAYNSITGNVAQGNPNGILLGSSTNNAVTGNTVQNNTTRGIYLNSSSNNTVSSNILSGSGGNQNNNAILTAGTSANNTIASNTITDGSATTTNYAINISDASSTSNYLADNNFTSTPGTSTINDASTSTIYASQPRGENGTKLTNRTTNDIQAFTIQNAGGSNIFTVDTSANQVTIGNSTTAGKLTLSDGSSNTATIAVAALGGNYTYTIPTTTADDTFCLVTLNNCAANAALFIQNQNAAAQATSNFWISGTGHANTSLLTPTIDTGTGVALNIGTTSATSVSIGKAATVTTINGKLGITLDATTGTTITCRNTSGYLSVCDASVLTPTGANFIQNGTSVQTSANFWIDGFGKVAGGVQTGNIDTIGAAGSLNIGTSSAGSLTIGKTGVTTTIQGNVGVTLNATTGTTQVCRNATGLLSSCDAAYLAPTATNFIQNQATTPGSEQTANFNITGKGMASMLQASTSVLTPLLDAAVASTVLTIGNTNASAINLNQSAVLAAGKSLTLTGGDTASRPAAPTDGMLYYDTETKQLLVYNATLTKWQANKSEAVLVAATDSSVADKAAADYVATGSGDQLQINSALSSADPAGSARKTGKVYLFAGTYTINGSVNIPNDTTLAGAGRGTIITIANNFNTAINAVTNTTTGGAGSGIVIQDLRLEGNRINNTAMVNMYGIYLNGVGANTTSAATVLGAKVLNVWSMRWRNGGIILSNTHASSVTNATLHDNSGMGILVSGGSANNIFSNNTIIANSNGIYMNTNAANNIVNGNFLGGNGVTGVALQSTTTANTVSNNRFVDNGNNNNNSIFLVASTNNTITNNTISDATFSATNYAINITDSSSTGNYLGGNLLGAGSINDAASANNTYGGQTDGSTNYDVQPAGTINLLKSTNVTGTLSTSMSVLTPSLDRASAGTLTIGTNGTNTTALTIGSGSITTTIQGNTGVTLNATTGTTMVCRNATGLLSACNAAYAAPTATNFIQNQNSSAQTTANFWISGSGQAATLTAGTVTASTNLVTPTIDTASAVALTLGGTTASSVDIGKSAGTINLKANSTLVGTSGSTITVQGAAQSTVNTAGNQFTLKGSTGNGSGAGGQLTLQGGDGGASSGANGGNVYISGGAGTSTGSSGLVVITTPTFSTVTNDANCFTGGAPVAASCTIASASVNGSSAILVGFTTDGQTAILPSPTITTAGRVIYVTASNTTSDFTLSVNGGGQGNLIAMRKNTTATMIWNGSAWTAAGASSSTTLQAAYDNTLQSAGGAELVVSKTSATNGFTIRDSATNSVNGALLTVQSSSAANLFSVNSNVTEYASDAGAEVYGVNTTTFPASTWSALTGTTISRYATAGNYIATGQGSVSAVTTAVANTGIKNQLINSAGAAAALNANTTYNVSFTTRLLSGTFTDMNVYYSIDGTAASVSCITGATTATSVWTKVNCTFSTPASGITSGNAILIRQTAGTARTFYIDNLSVTIAADYNFATDGGAGNAATFGTNWVSAGLGTVAVTQNTGDGYDASNSAQGVISAGAANAGLRNKLSSNPLPSTLYRITVYAKSSNTFNDFKIRYSRDGSTTAGGNYVDCVDYNTQSISTSIWTKVTCYITTDATTATNPYVYFVETASAARTIYVDAFSMTLRTSTTPNVQVGGGVNGGPTTLLTLDKGASAPIASDNDALLGSMYYDTTLGKLQCYEADGWGACGSSPDTVVTISPEFNNAVLHGTGVGTMTSDICSDTLNINDGSSGQPTICGSNETYNFYKWTSPQASAQTYGIYVTYQLPSTFKEFASGQTSVMGRTDNASSSVSYQIYRSDSDTGLTACGSSVSVSSGVQTSWQRVAASGAADPSTCGFEPNDSIVFKINMTASGTSNAYVGNLNFIFTNR